MAGPRRQVPVRVAQVVVLVLLAGVAQGDEYLSRDAFLAQAFGDQVPAMQTLWLTGERRAAAEQVTGVAPRGLRVRYWQAGQRTAWILEDIGKEKPITLGIVIQAHRIERLEVLAFRESRGWEIRYPFYTRQFSGLTLGEDGALSAPVDGITGATLSVRATERVARLALWLEAQALPG